MKKFNNITDINDITDITVNPLHHGEHNEKI